MNKQELFDLIIAEYRWERSRRKIEADGSASGNEAEAKQESGLMLTEQLCLLWIAEAEHDIASRLRPVTGYESFTLFPGTDTYSLPADYGSIVAVVTQQEELRHVSLREIPVLAQSGAPNQFCIYEDRYPKIQFFPSPGSETPVTVWYHRSPAYSIPNPAAIEADFAAPIFLPSRFYRAVKYSVLSRVFPEYSALYENELRVKKQLDTAADAVLGYSFGGS